MDTIPFTTTRTTTVAANGSDHLEASHTGLTTPEEAAAVLSCMGVHPAQVGRVTACGTDNNGSRLTLTLDTDSDTIARIADMVAQAREPTPTHHSCP